MRRQAGGAQMARARSWHGLSRGIPELPGPLHCHAAGPGRTGDRLGMGNGHRNREEDKDREENGNWDRKRDGDEDRNHGEDRKRDGNGNEGRDRDGNGNRKRDKNENGNRYRDENGVGMEIKMGIGIGTGTGMKTGIGLWVDSDYPPQAWQGLRRQKAACRSWNRQAVTLNHGMDVATSALPIPGAGGRAHGVGKGPRVNARTGDAVTHPSERLGSVKKLGAN